MSFELGGNAPFIGVLPQSSARPAPLKSSLRRRGSRRSSGRSNREQIQTQRSDLRLRQPYLRAVSLREHSHHEAYLTARRSTKSSRPRLSRRFRRSKSETGWSLGCERRAQRRKPGTDTSTHGPLIHARAADKVESHIKDAVAKGAKLLIGGERGEGSFFQPTVLSGITPDARVLQEETFGPLAALVEFESEAEVLQAANDTSVGLAGYFFSRDIGRIYRVAEGLQVGMVGVNTGLISQAACPFGGIKESWVVLLRSEIQLTNSGWGKEGSKYGIEDYMITKFVAIGGLKLKA